MVLDVIINFNSISDEDQSRTNQINILKDVVERRIVAKTCQQKERLGDW